MLNKIKLIIIIIIVIIILIIIIMTIHKGKATHIEGLTLPNNNTIKGLSLEESYKYLGVQQAEDVKHHQVKKQTSAEYTNSVHKILKSMLNEEI